MSTQPIDELLDEHRTIEPLLELLERVADRLDANLDVPADLFPDLLEFFLAFADRCHHGKEEEVLFPALEGHGVSRHSGPIGVVLAEHDLGRRYVNTLAEAARHYVQSNPGSNHTLAKSARGCARLFREHFHKENTILYPMATVLLSDDELTAISQQFRALERERLGDSEYQRLRQMASQLASQLQF